MCGFDGENPRTRIREVDGEFAGQSNRDCELDVLIRIQPDKLNDMISLHDSVGIRNEPSVFLYVTYSFGNLSCNPLKSMNWLRAEIPECKPFGDIYSGWWTLNGRNISLCLYHVENERRK